MSDYINIRYHRDGTLTYWSVYKQVWMEHQHNVPDEELAAMSDSQRDQVLEFLNSVKCNTCTCKGGFNSELIKLAEAKLSSAGFKPKAIRVKRLVDFLETFGADDCEVVSDNWPSFFNMKDVKYFAHIGGVAPENRIWAIIRK